MNKLVEDVAEYLHWREVNPHIKGGENYLRRFRDDLAEHRAEPISDVVASGWMPIESAPRDGTTIILWHGESGLRDRVVVGAYDENAKNPWRFCNNPFPLAGYEHDGGGDGMANAFLSAPTHWMALPSVPQPDEGTL